MKLEEVKNNQTGSGREKGIPQQSFEFKIGKYDTLVHYFYKNVHVSVSTVPLLLQGGMLYYLSWKLVIFVYVMQTNSMQHLLETFSLFVLLLEVSITASDRKGENTSSLFYNFIFKYAVIYLVCQMCM